MNKVIKEICAYIKDNPDCIIEYCDNKNFTIYKKSKQKFIQKNDWGWDWYCNDESESYINNLSLIFLECAKKGIDISKIKIKSC